jgi:hypothetical protein
MSQIWFNVPLFYLDQDHVAIEELLTLEIGLGYWKHSENDNSPNILWVCLRNYHKSMMRTKKTRDFWSHDSRERPDTTCKSPKQIWKIMTWQSKQDWERGLLGGNRTQLVVARNCTQQQSKNSIGILQSNRRRIEDWRPGADRNQDRRTKSMNQKKKQNWEQAKTQLGSVCSKRTEVTRPEKQIEELPWEPNPGTDSKSKPGTTAGNWTSADRH